MIGVVWAVYSLIHIFHIGHHHEMDADTGSHLTGRSPKALFFFAGSLIAHCLASGMLLALSHEISEKIASTVFMALVAHKGYEAMMLSSILAEQKMSRPVKMLLFSGIVCLSRWESFSPFPLRETSARILQSSSVVLL